MQKQIKLLKDSAIIIVSACRVRFLYNSTI